MNDSSSITPRIAGTLVFWKSAARKNGRFHYCCISWTIFSTAMIPFFTQAINPADPASKWLVTTISAHIAILVGFHRGLKVPERYQAFRHGESEFYDLYRRLLDQPETFGPETEERIRKYFNEAAIVRRFVRKAETDSIPSLEDIRRKPDTTTEQPKKQSIRLRELQLKVSSCEKR